MKAFTITAVLVGGFMFGFLFGFHSPADPNNAIASALLLGAMMMLPVTLGAIELHEQWGQWNPDKEKP